MKKNGFTLVELLAVLIIVGLLLVLTIPAYANIYSGIRRENLNGKITEIEAAALKYGSKIKDEIKDDSDRCIQTNVDELISKGYLISESDGKNAIYSPTDGAELNDTINICYSIVNFDVEVFYTKAFNESKYYYKGEIVSSGNKFYKCINEYPGKGGIHATNDKGKKYFEVITY